MKIGDDICVKVQNKEMQALDEQPALDNVCLTIYIIFCFVRLQPTNLFLAC
jgi:hypothetical protein